MWGRFRLLSNFGRSLSSAASTSVVSDTTTAAAKSNSEIPVLYSFLQPSIFALRKDPNPSPPPHPSPRKAPRSPDSSSLETALESSLLSNDAEEAWRTFKTLTSHSHIPSPQLTASLITHLCSLGDRLSLKRAFAAALFLLEKNPGSLSFEALETLFSTLDSANSPAPAISLVKAMLKNRFLRPSLYGATVCFASPVDMAALGLFLAFLTRTAGFV
ncbi:hypothetical protein HPP92_007699 [Vanilla planifolia]|uniref:At1g68980-like TPR repeats domain-containing protein n=1 Tax=Vanilla planifolia TaxID=51239 RepID=A0A835REN5_VANPL|nr:hypothetical protein HPP92_007699 [Vanilla planifolia]